ARPLCEAHQRPAQSNIWSRNQISRADTARTCFAALSQRRSALTARVREPGRAGQSSARRTRGAHGVTRRIETRGNSKTVAMKYPRATKADAKSAIRLWEPVASARLKRRLCGRFRASLKARRDRRGRA